MKDKTEEELRRIRSEIKGLVGNYHSLMNSQNSFEEGVSRVDPSGKLFGEEELQNGVEAVLDGNWTEGRFTRQFEKGLAGYLGSKHTLLTNSGSSANLLAFYALTSPELGENRIQKGDEVISVAAAFPTSVTPIIQYGAVPVFLDIDPLETGQYNIDTSRLENAITDKTKAIFLAHTLGNPFNLEKILELKKKNNLWLIEDSCDALGSEYDGKKIGTFGDVSTFSFYPAHHITMGEGGAVSTDNSKLFKILRSFRNWGRDCWCPPGEDDTCGKRFGWDLGDLPLGYDHKNIYTHLGFNLKNTDLHAAIGLAQLGRINDFTKKRKENFEYLREELGKYEDHLVLPNSLPIADPSWFGFLISTRPGSNLDRDDFVNYLTKNKVMTRPLFCGNITRQPLFSGNDVPYRTEGSLENSDLTMKNTFWVGVQPNLTPEKREYMNKIMRNYLEKL